MASPPIGAILAVQATATTGNVNGAGFNPTATYFNTDLAATVGTTSAPSVTSASYTFVSGDINSWVYIKLGTNWIPGWYQITNVISGAAILNATIGAAILTIGTTGVVTYSSATGCVTGSYVSGTASGTYGVDYSQNNTAIATSTTATSTGAGAVILFAGSTQSMLGNYVQIISGTLATPGWYEIIAETAGVSITTDRSSVTGIASGITMNIGGAGRLNGNEDAFQAMLPAGAQVFVKNGSYTLSAAISTASTQGTATSSIYWNGYNSIRGDACNGANRPLIIAGANAVQWSQYHLFYNFSFTTSTLAGINCQRTGIGLYNCKALNTSTTAAQIAVSSAGGPLVGCEIISQNGKAISPAGAFGLTLVGCYIHDSANGVLNTASVPSVYAFGNIFESITSIAFSLSSSNSGYNFIQGNTIYGTEAIQGTGLLFGASSPSNFVDSNIFYGLTNAVQVTTTTTTSCFGGNNDYFNNTTDATLWTKSATDLALNPNFSGASQLTGTTATATGGTQTLTDSGASFGVTDGVDFLHITSVTGGTGTIVGCYLITGHTSTTLTTNNLIGATGSITGIHYYVTHGHNFQIGTNLKAMGFPSLTNATGSQTTSYLDVGATQRQESSGTSGGSFTFVG